jgi:hypothetical protein
VKDVDSDMVKDAAVGMANDVVWGKGIHADYLPNGQNEHNKNKGEEKGNN